MTKAQVLIPRLSEKSYSLSGQRVYVVDVNKSLNKHTIARAISEQFNVEVKTVNVVNVKGKMKQTRNLNGTRYANAKGRRNSFKKAYITLKAGHELPFFEAVKEEEDKEKTLQAKYDKALAKEEAKENKSKKKLFSIAKKTPKKAAKKGEK